MERILVAINNKYGGWEALTHACSLAKRMAVKLYVLLVTPSPGKKPSMAQQEIQHQLKERVILVIEKAKNEGIEIQYYTTEGNYADEIISFTKTYNISLLISEIRSGAARGSKQEDAVLHSLRHRLSCRMEVVAQKQKPLG